MGEGNNCNSNESVLMGGTNIIKSSVVVTNMICGNEMLLETLIHQ